MATRTYYAINALTGGAGDEAGWEDTSETPVSAATMPTGWVVGTGATNHSEMDAQSERASSTFTGTTVPDGTLDTTLKDAFRIGPLTGAFASGNWTFNFSVRSTVQAGAADGRIRFRLIKADADGANASEITGSQQQGSLCSNVGSGADVVSSLTVNPGAITLANQCVFVQVAWERTGAGGMSTTNMRLRAGVSSSEGTRFVTSDFNSHISGTSSPAFTGSAVITGRAPITGTSSPAFTGSATLTAAASMPPRNIARMLAAAAVAWAAATDFRVVDFAGGGTSTQPAAPSPIAGTSSQAFTGSATLTGNGALAGTSAPAFTNTATLTGKGALAGTSSPAFTGSATLLGRGALAGVSSPAFAATGTMAAGAISGASSFAFAGSATLVGDGALAGVSSPAFTDTGTLRGRGALAGQSSPAFADSVTLRGRGALAGVSAPAFTDVATLLGKGRLLGLSSPAFTGSATLTGVQPGMSGTSSVTFTGTALLRGKGALAASSTPAFLASASVRGIGSLAGLGAVAFAPTATIRDGSIIVPVYGWGARSMIGRAARDPWSSIGTDRANDAAGSIGTESAGDSADSIGTDTA